MNFTTLLYMVGALFAGILIPIQTGFNTQLARAMHGPMISVLAVYVVGLALVLSVTLLMRTPLPTSEQIAAAPRLAWVAGGVLSALYVFLLIVLAPRLGAATTVAFVVLGQIACSVFIDHFGLLGFPEHLASPQRLAGVALLAAGVALVRIY
jgi:transporter family-2 protein